MNKRIEEQYNKAPHAWIWQILIVIGVMAKQGFEMAKSIVGGIFTPDLKMLFNLTEKGVPFLLLETICIAFLGTVVGAVISIPISFLSATNLVPKPIALIGRV
ncbi:MAG: phosphonate ABC transporter, permease protein PhnE, partial [Clostridia bacterium]